METAKRAAESISCVQTGVKMVVLRSYEGRASASRAKGRRK